MRMIPALANVFTLSLPLIGCSGYLSLKHGDVTVKAAIVYDQRLDTYAICTTPDFDCRAWVPGACPQ